MLRFELLRHGGEAQLALSGFGGFCLPGLLSRPGINPACQLIEPVPRRVACLFLIVSTPMLRSEIIDIDVTLGLLSWWHVHAADPVPSRLLLLPRLRWYPSGPTALHAVG